MPGKSPIKNKSCLVISESGRALAETAVRAGFEVTVIDRFGDADTQQLAPVVRVYRDKAVDFSNYSRLIALIELCYTENMSGIITGSGFESCPGVLERLAEQYPIIGNSPAVIRAVKNPEIFFPTLEALGIPYPETRLVPPEHAGRWLCKRTGASGGRHVQNTSETDAVSPDKMYFQKYQDGLACSVLFLADGENTVCVGLNEILQRGESHAGWVFAGAITLPMKRFNQMHELGRITCKLAKHFGLVGLCGMDFIYAQDTIFVLEVNPRPTATLLLHDVDGELFNAHLSACRGLLNYIGEEHEMPYRAIAIYYPELPIRIAEHIKWPDWVSDVPVPGQDFTAAVPLCTIHAKGLSRLEVEGLLAQRRRQLSQIICSRSLSC